MRKTNFTFFLSVIFCCVFVFLLNHGYAQVASKATENITRIKASLLSEKQEAQAELSGLQAHLQKVQGFIASLKPGENRESLELSQQAMEKDKIAIEKVNLRLREIDQRLRLAERAERNLKQNSGKDAGLAVTEIKGKVRVLRAGVNQDVALTSDMQLGIGDVVKTGKDSFLTLVMVNGNRIEIHPNSEFQLLEDNLDSCKSQLKAGMFKAKIKKLLYRRFEVHTPTCAVSVRGTEFEVKIDEQGLTHVTVFEGQVEVQKTAVVSAGEIWSEK